MADQANKGGAPAQAPEDAFQAPPGLYSAEWFAAQGPMQLKDGVWVAPALAAAPLSSSTRAGAHKPRNMREKREQEAQEKAAHPHAAPAAQHSAAG